MRNLFLKFFSLLGISLFLSSMAQAQAIKIRWAHPYQPVEVYHQQALVAARTIESQTEGRVQIEVVPAGKLGKEPDYPDMLSQGKLEMCYCGIAMLSTQYSPLALSHYPFAFRDIDHVRRYLSSPLLDELMQGFQEKTGNVMLAGVYYGARHVTSNVPIQKPEDFRGLRFRVAGAAPYRLFGTSMGAVVDQTPLGEVYDAFKDKRLDMQENPLPTIKNRRFYEQQKYVALTSHIYDITSAVVSKSAWAKMSEHDQGIMRKEIKKLAIWVAVGVIAQELVDEDILKAKGMTILNVDRALFREKMANTALPEVLGLRAGDYDKLQSIGKRLHP